jgi:hypothetical protein
MAEPGVSLDSLPCGHPASELFRYKNERKRLIMDYKTKYKIFGLPFIHITSGKLVDGHYKRGIAKGWIAIGDISFGVIFSVGAVAFGGIAIGGLSIGLLSLAGLALGVFSLGGGAIGIVACGGGAIAWHAAVGGLGVAHEYAEGGLAIANHANDLIARDYFENSRFFSVARFISEHSRWFLLLVAIPIVQNLIRRIKHCREKSNTR